MAAFGQDTSAQFCCHRLHGLLRGQAIRVIAADRKHGHFQLRFSPLPVLCHRLRNGAVILEAGPHCARNGVGPYVLVDGHHIRSVGIVFEQPGERNTLFAAREPNASGKSGSWLNMKYRRRRVLLQGARTAAALGSTLGSCGFDHMQTEVDIVRKIGGKGIADPCRCRVRRPHYRYPQLIHPVHASPPLLLAMS